MSGEDRAFTVGLVHLQGDEGRDVSLHAYTEERPRDHIGKRGYMQARKYTFMKIQIV